MQALPTLICKITLALMSRYFYKSGLFHASIYWEGFIVTASQEWMNHNTVCWWFLLQIVCMSLCTSVLGLHTGTLCESETASDYMSACVCVCSRAHVNVHEGERFPNMSLECLLYPIQYLFLAPHISVLIDSSDSRQDNNRTALPLSFSPPLLLPSPRSTTQGWRDGNREIKGGWTRGRRNWPLCVTSFFQNPCAGAQRWREKMSEWRRKMLGDGNKWARRMKTTSRCGKLREFSGGDNGGDATEMVSKRENKGSKETENGRGSDGESGGRMLMGQGGRHMRGGSKMRRDDEEKKYTSKWQTGKHKIKESEGVEK